MNKILELIEPEIYEIEAHLSDAFWKIWTWSEQNALESNRQAPWYKEVQRQKRLKKINRYPFESLRQPIKIGRCNKLNLTNT